MSAVYHLSTHHHNQAYISLFTVTLNLNDTCTGRPTRTDVHARHVISYISGAAPGNFPRWGITGNMSNIGAIAPLTISKGTRN